MKYHRLFSNESLYMYMQIYEMVWSENQIYLFESNNIHILSLLWPAVRNKLIFRSKQSTGAPSK